MKLAPRRLIGGESQGFRASLLASAMGAVAGRGLPGVDQWCNPESRIEWAGVHRALATDPRAADEVLRRLHFRRGRELGAKALHNIWRFLLDGYAMTGDVRYFNELLWFAREGGYPGGGHIESLALDLFFGNLDPAGRHTFPHGDAREIGDLIGTLTTATKLIARRASPGVKVGLLGSPSFFTKVRSELIGLQFDPRCYLVRHHADRLPRILLQSPLMLRMFLAIRGVNFPYEDLGSDTASPLIGAALKRDEIDLCFHKLGFIIRRGTIEGSKLGIINDHWGALPFVRGRSTIEWSLIHGIPLVATTHLVDEGIDSGRLIAMFDYSDAIAGLSKVSEVRKVIKRDAVRRAVLSICQLAANGDATIQNPSTLGATFYSMHPELIRHAERAGLGCWTAA